MRIRYFFRNKQIGYSIQTVFQTIVCQVKKQTITKETYLPSPFANIIAIMQNGIYAKNQQKDSEINHITGDAHYLLLFLKGGKTIVTVHDIIYYHFLHGIKKVLWKLLYIYPLKRAAYVTFISEFAKQQVLEVIHLSEDKTKVIFNPVSSQYSFVEKVFNANNPRILHIGTRKIKNLERTILALRGIPCHLRIVGRLSEDDFQALRDNHIDYSNVYDLSEAQIVEEYREADIINFPSLFEGFGMPIIEGQATGRVVITSDLSPMKEVAGNGAVLVNPLSVESIRNGYQKILQSETFRNTLIKRGKENVSRFTADKIADQYMQIYNLMT